MISWGGRSSLNHALELMESFKEAVQELRLAMYG